MEQKGTKNKALCVIRTSTSRQEIEEQRKEVLSMALQDGFKEEDIIVVGKQGASAIKLDDAYRENMEKVYDHLDRGNIACIYAWAIDRIGRNEEILMQFKNKVIATHTQLKIKNPSLILMNEDGSVNNGIELAFTLFATLSKQEMESKKARFQRSKKRNREVGRWNGGRLLFGYAAGEDGKLVIDKTNGELVRRIFQEYADSPVGIQFLANKYPSVTWKPNAKDESRVAYVNRLLKTKAYTGTVLYPQLIEDSLFERVQQKLKDFRILPKVQYKTEVYYCQGLIYDCTDEENPHAMRVKKSEVSYVSKTEKYSVGLNTIDSMVLQILQEKLSKFGNFKLMGREKERLLDKYTADLKKLKLDKKELEDKLEELDERYFTSSLSKPKYESMRKKLENEVAVKEMQIKFSQMEYLNASTAMENFKTMRNIDLYKLSDEERRNIILDYVERIDCSKIDKWCSEISLTFKGVLKAHSSAYLYNRQSKVFQEKETGKIDRIQVVREVKGRKRDYSQNKKNGKQLNIQG